MKKEDIFKIYIHVRNIVLAQKLTKLEQYKEHLYTFKNKNYL